MRTDTSFHLGHAWQFADPILEQPLRFVPRIGETVEFRFGIENPDPMLVLDVRHTIISDVQLVEVLVYPKTSITPAILEFVKR